MSVELSYLAMYGVFTLVLILVQLLISMAQHGLVALAGNREGLVSTGMAARAEKAVNNSILTMALVAPAAVMVSMTESGGATTELAIRIFLAARVAYAVVFIMGIPWLRTLTWVASFFCILALYLAVL